MRLAEVEQGLEELIPLHLAESWDPVGRQLGRGDQTIKRMMLTIDATESVVEEAIAAQVDLLLAYHPGLGFMAVVIAFTIVKSTILL